MKSRKFLVPALGWVFVNQISYHRNGVAGEGFHAVKFRLGRAKYLATVFDAPGRLAVLFANGDIGDNARMRGDLFEGALRRAIAAFDEATGDWATEAELSRRSFNRPPQIVSGERDYFIETTCFATVREMWRLRATAAPTDEEAAEALTHGDAEFVRERAEDEEDRKVVCVRSEDIQW